MSCLLESQGSFLQGWKKDWKDKRAWEGDFPRKEMFKLWVQFIKDNIKDDDEPAGLEGPPNISDYKESTKKGEALRGYEHCSWEPLPIRKGGLASSG